MWNHNPPQQRDAAQASDSFAVSFAGVLGIQYEDSPFFTAAITLATRQLHPGEAERGHTQPFRIRLLEPTPGDT
jgi:hypothetical protein